MEVRVAVSRVIIDIMSPVAFITSCQMKIPASLYLHFAMRVRVCWLLLVVVYVRRLGVKIC